LFLGLIAISIYIVWAFFGVANGINSYSFAGIVLATLLFDILVASGLYIVSGMFFSEFQVDIFFITALLTILGYSINNTIVVFDRIRYNIKVMVSQHKKLDEIINVSLSETITRSIFTSLTLLFVLVTTFLFGPESMRGFILVLIYGTVIGTYSSLFLASSLLFQFNKNTVLKVYEKKVMTDDDKVVV
jgi:preprotein translocase SecF subunit